MAEDDRSPDDELIAEEDELEKMSAAARLFDVRRVIGGLFLVYGLVVTLRGILDSKAQIDKAQGVRINLWMGIAMLLLGAFMLLWLRLNPPKAPDLSGDRGPDGTAGQRSD